MAFNRGECPRADIEESNSGMCLACGDDLSKQNPPGYRYTGIKLLEDFVLYVRDCAKCRCKNFSCRICRIEIYGSVFGYKSEGCFYGGYDSDSIDLCILRHIAAKHYGFGESVHRNANIQYRIAQHLMPRGMYSGLNKKLEYVVRHFPYLVLLVSSAEDSDYTALANIMIDTPRDNISRSDSIITISGGRNSIVEQFLMQWGYECSLCGCEFDCLPSFDVFIEHISTHSADRPIIAGKKRPSMVKILNKYMKNIREIFFHALHEMKQN